MADASNMPRLEKSLSFLTGRFMAMLHKSPNGILDLKTVSNS